MRSAAWLTASIALASCAPPSMEVVTIPVPPPDDFRPGPNDALASLEAASALDVAPEAMLPVAGYLAAFHRRLHAGFAEGTLLEYERTHPRLERDLVVGLDLAVAASDGRLADLRLVETSGADAFDWIAIAALFRASPFGPPPREVLGIDDRAHLVWRFHSRAEDPCGIKDASIRAEP